MARIKIFRTLAFATPSNDDVERAVRMVVTKEKIRDPEISVIFIDDRKMKRMNTEYLQHRYSTDVLAFLLESRPALEGEVYVCIDMARRQAKEYGVPVREEILRLVIHGVLHLCGYEDETFAGSQEMHEREDAVLVKMKK